MVAESPPLAAEGPDSRACEGFAAAEKYSEIELSEHSTDDP